MLSSLLERRGAEVIKLPLVAIHDSPDEAGVVAWLRRFTSQPPDYFVLLTGEGLRRLLGFAERAGCKPEFEAALAATCCVCRGPKPGRVLRELSLKPGYQAQNPTSAGVIEAMEGFDLSAARVAVQLYGDEPNVPLVSYLEKRAIEVDCVAPYRYSSHSETEQVRKFIIRLHAGDIDAIAFTSQPQFKRLLAVARESGLESELRQGLANICIAAIGPIVRQQLEAEGFNVAVMPQGRYSMKPLVSALAQRLAKD